MNDNLSNWSNLKLTINNSDNDPNRLLDDVNFEPVYQQDRVPTKKFGDVYYSELTKKWHYIINDKMWQELPKECLWLCKSSLNSKPCNRLFNCWISKRFNIIAWEIVDKNSMH